MTVTEDQEQRRNHSCRQKAKLGVGVCIECILGAVEIRRISTDAIADTDMYSYAYSSLVDSGQFVTHPRDDRGVAELKDGSGHEHTRVCDV